MADITFTKEAERFVYRVAGILIHDNKLLVMKDENYFCYYIPGGKVALQELSTDAITGELREELKIDVHVGRMLWLVENFFKEDVCDEIFHEISFYYLVELKDDEILKRGNEFVMIEEGKHELVFYWKPLEEIKDLYLYPLFLKERILNLPNGIEHIVENKLLDK
ncbi:NUDIX hydrolase [Bacillus gaemokensis]|uniref:NUDIX hydrolase n=1 Tax=Bacillus gaemokensis TaxID=574375 RepID=A0A073KMB7_9BACI|nr:NUDIX domain-containing protein [Bacillus gaemokensis]KEK23473.1 NUDIX hydrolase [Bacillus gaemokensis]KYG27158.1 NUDIX hydrolase [Bacillus gaemokensis]